MNAKVTDALPTGVTFSYTAVASTGSRTDVIGTQTGAINDLVDLLPLGTVTYTVTATIPASFTGNLVNTARVTQPTNVLDNNSFDNTATDTDTPCSKPGLTGVASEFTKIGISDRDGIPAGWPGTIPSGFIALESANKGFVITRVQDDTFIADPKEGMLIYDITSQCVKLYYDSSWHCIQRYCETIDLKAGISSSATTISTGTPIDIVYSITNIGTAATYGNLITVTLSKSILSTGTMTPMLIPSGWTKVSETAQSIQFTSNNIILPNVKVEFAYSYTQTIGAQGSSVIRTIITNGSGGDTVNSNNIASQVLTITP
jgi:hypothetical protein